MARLTKEESRRRWSELRDLICEWDPIGVTAGTDWPRDEYDCLVDGVMRQLESGGDRQAVESHLRSELEGHFSLDPQRYDLEDIARRIHGWFNNAWSGSES